MRLDDIITLSKDNNKNVEDLLWKMLLLFASVKNSDEAVNKMYGRIIENCNASDYTLRWLVLLILRSVFYKAERKRAATGMEVSKWIGRIPDEIFVHFSALLIY